MKKNIRVCLVTECPYSGVLRAIVENAKILKKNGLKIDFILPLSVRNRYGETQNQNELELQKYGSIIKTPLRRSAKYLLSDKHKLSLLFSKNNYLFVVSYSNYAGKICRLLYYDFISKNAIKTVVNLRKNYIFSMNNFLKLWTI